MCLEQIVMKYIDKYGNKPIPCAKLYEVYVNKCSEPMSIRWFGREVKKSMNRVRKTNSKGKRVWCYVAKLSKPETQIDTKKKVWDELKNSINNMDDLLEHIGYLNYGLYARIKRALENESDTW